MGGAWKTGGNEQFQEVVLTGLRDGPCVGTEEPRRKAVCPLGQAESEAPVGHPGIEVQRGGHHM